MLIYKISAIKLTAKRACPLPNIRTHTKFKRSCKKNAIKGAG